MRTALDRFTAPLFAWIPDISAAPPRRQVTIGVVASVVLHVIALLVMALLAGVVKQPLQLAQPAPQPAALELEIIQPEEREILPAPLAQEKRFIDSRALAESKPAVNPIFESDKDMTAASEKPATGDLALPSQDGRGKIENVFDTTKAVVGSVKEQPAPVIEIASARPVAPAPASKPQPPVKETAQQKPAPVQPASTPAPSATPPPKEAEKDDAAKLAKATLKKLREVELKRDHELALAAKQLPLLPTAITQVERPAPAPSEQMAKLTPPAPSLTKPGYQPEQEKSRVEGRITNRGKNAVDSVATPLGKYKAQVYNAVGSRWLYYVKSQMDLLAIGTAKVSFFVTRTGRVQGIHVDGNTANASFAEVCERAIRDAEISQPPAGSLDQMRDGRLEYTITFTLYSLHE